MAEELELDLDLDEDPNINRTEERIRKLSSKVKEQAGETATEREQRIVAEERAEKAEKRAEFLDGFTGLASKYPNATEHRDAIQEKVLAGYSIEDATVSVLAAEGQFVPQTQASPPTDSPLGGSAVTASLSGDQKSVPEMSREEKREALLEADKRGEIAEFLKH